MVYCRFSLSWLTEQGKGFIIVRLRLQTFLRLAIMQNWDNILHCEHCHYWLAGVKVRLKMIILCWIFARYVRKWEKSTLCPLNKYRRFFILQNCAPSLVKQAPFPHHILPPTTYGNIEQREITAPVSKVVTEIC